MSYTPEDDLLEVIKKVKRLIVKNERLENENRGLWKAIDYLYNAGSSMDEEIKFWDMINKIRRNKKRRPPKPKWWPF